MYMIIVLFLNNLTLSTFRHPILQARKGKNNYEKHYKSRSHIVRHTANNLRRYYDIDRLRNRYRSQI